MFRFHRDGAQVVTLRDPVWVKVLDNGCFGLCREEEAQGVSIDGAVYHIAGREDIPGVETVSVGEVSESAYQKEQAQALAGKAGREEVDAIAAAIEKGMNL